jgi:hypothetical protein
MTLLPMRENLHDGGRYILSDKFLRVPKLNADINSATEATREIANPDFEILGTNAASADQVHDAVGGFVLKTAGAATDSAILLPHLDTNQTAWSKVTWLPSKQPSFVTNVKTPASITNCTYWAGYKLTNTATVATDDDQVFFRYANGTDTTWKCIYSIAGTDVSVDSGVTVAVSTVYRLWIMVDSAAIARFYINGTLVATSTALTASAALIPYVGVLSATDATAKTLTIRNIECGIALS